MTLGKPRRFDTDYHPVAAEKPCMTTTQAKQTQDDRSSWPTWGGSGAARTQWLLRLMAAATLVIAAALRLWRLDLTIFERDEGAIVRVAEGIVRLGSRPLSGPVFSQGIPSAPHFMYLLAPIVALSRDPAFISGAIAVANLAGIAGTLWLGWRAFGPVGGITASLLYAVSPWAVFYARRIWQPDILPPMAVLLFVALDLAVIERRAWWAAVTFPVAVLAVLVHPAFATLLPVLCVPLVLLVIWRRWLPLVLGLGLAACMTVPTLLYGAQTHWVDVANMRYYSSLHTWIDLEAVRYALVAATGLAAPGRGHCTPVRPRSASVAGASWRRTRDDLARRRARSRPVLVGSSPRRHAAAPGWRAPLDAPAGRADDPTHAATAHPLFSDRLPGHFPPSGICRGLVAETVRHLRPLAGGGVRGVAGRASERRSNPGLECRRGNVRSLLRAAAQHRTIRRA